MTNPRLSPTALSDITLIRSELDFIKFTDETYTVAEAGKLRDRLEFVLADACSNRKARK